MSPKWHNKLYVGDNLQVLPLLEAESVDLIYLDPPFNSQASYNVLFKERSGERSSAQIAAFQDTWRWGHEAQTAYDEVVLNGPHGVSQLMKSFYTCLKTSDMTAYLAMMAPRLLQLHRVLKQTGSLYLHCDPTASHYLKLLLDAVFGPANFRNEIVWRRTGAHNSARRYGPIHDIILFYTKGPRYTWNPIHRPYMKGYIESYFDRKDGDRRYRSQTLTGAGVRRGASGRPWRGHDPTAKGRHWAVPRALVDELGLEDEPSLHARLDALDARGLLAPSRVDGLPEYRQYLDRSKGLLLQDIWAYQPYTDGCLAACAQAIDADVKWLEKRRGVERLHYPTQKPEGLLKRIVKASSNKGDLVLDPFCGCGTAVAVAEQLSRRWIGIDITHIAVSHVRKRLGEMLGTFLAPLEAYGLPRDVESARALARENPYKFQDWALWAVGAKPARRQRGDRGVDGYLPFREDHSDHYGLLVVQVKGGQSVAPRDVRELIGTLANESADIGLLVTLDPPSAAMTAAAAEAGFYHSESFRRSYPRIQIRSVAELLQGKMPDYPLGDPTAVMKQAATKGPEEYQPNMFDPE